MHRGTSSNGRALASHARGTGIDAPVLHFFLDRKNGHGNQRSGLLVGLPKPVRMAERSKAPDLRVDLLSVTEVFWSTDVGVGLNPTSDKFSSNM